MRVVFVHGAAVKDGNWWWHRTAAALDARGIASFAAVLPSVGETGRDVDGDGPGLADDVASVRQVLTASDEPMVVVGHSYGGIVTSEAAAGIASVRHIVFVSSYLPEVGESLSTFGSDDGPAPFLELDTDGGTFGVRAAALVETFLHDCDAEVQADAFRHLARQSVAVLGQPVGASAWEDVPNTYLICTKDRGTPVESQRRFSGRAGSVVEVDAGHHPFLSRPRVVAELLAGLR